MALIRFLYPFLSSNDPIFSFKTQKSIFHLLHRRPSSFSLWAINFCGKKKKKKIQSESVVLFNATLITCFLITGWNDPLFPFTLAIFPLTRLLIFILKVVWYVRLLYFLPVFSVFFLEKMLQHFV